MLRVLVTGSNGFVGRATVSACLHAGFAVRAGVRRRTGANAANFSEQALRLPADVVEYGALASNTDWSSALDNVDCVIHLAARAHVMSDRASDPLAEFRQTNVEGTLSLARAAAARGINKFIYVSSIKVNGERTSLGHPFTAEDEPLPADPYGISKFEAEQGLRELEQHSELDVVIVRPVLVYGPGVKANFRTIMRVLNTGVPLPLGGLSNRRSLVGLGNLANFLVTCAQLEAAAHKTFLVSDGEDLSTSELLRRLALLLDRPVRLFNFPTSALERVAMLLGKGNVAQRLLGTLQVDSSATRAALGWVPPFSVDEELQRTVESYLKEGGSR
jgi:nucleoside-diphosphate-sugar epimerase